MFQTLDHSPHGFHCHRPSTIDRVFKVTQKTQHQLQPKS